MCVKRHAYSLFAPFLMHRTEQRSGAALQWLNIADQIGTLPSISAYTLSICSSVGFLVCGRVQESFPTFLQFSLVMQASSAGRCHITMTQKLIEGSVNVACNFAH